MYSIYYQAKIEKKRTWFFVGALRSLEGLAFERTIDKEQGIFEFFVSSDMETLFLQFMDQFLVNGIATDMRKLPNRLFIDNKN